MGNKAKVFVLLVSIIAIGGSIFFGGLTLYHQDPTMHRYTGKEVFYTNQDYKEFKEFLIQKGIEIEDVKALSSEPPILVSYQIVLPAEMLMPYTYEYRSDKLGPYQEGAAAVWGGGLAVGIMLVVVIGSLLWKDKKDELEKNS